MELQIEIHCVERDLVERKVLAKDILGVLQKEK